MQRILQTGRLIKERVQKNFRYATLNFLFILLFVNVFQWLFGMENSIVGVIFTIMMSASMVRDLTATPLRNLLVQTAVLFLMTASACFVANAAPLAALGVNLAMIFIILYAFTYEYVSHLYFPYLLSYLFLIFITPVGPAQLPKRLLGVLFGAVGVIVYQWVNGRNRVAQTAREVLLSLLDRADAWVKCLLGGQEASKDPEQMRCDLCRLSKAVYDRRKKALCLSDASFAMIDCGRGLENLVLTLYELKGPLTPQRAALLGQIAACLSDLRAFTLRSAESIPPINIDLGAPDSEEAGELARCLSYIRDQMLFMTRPDKRKRYRKTRLPLSARLKAALNMSPVRVIYALRVSCLLALLTLAVQSLHLAHGKWLLFTVASVSLPYADDVGLKAKKRMIATLVGGLAGMAAFSLIPSAPGRSAIMMLSGYLSFYFCDYAATFSCSTVGALGGAVLMTATGWGPVGGMTLLRLGYVLAGIVIGLLFNRVLFPYRLSSATRHLYHSYRSDADLLEKICRQKEVDPQLYYGLVIKTHLQESQLKENALKLNWTGARSALEKCRARIRQAHRARADLKTPDSLCDQLQ